MACNTYEHAWKAERHHGLFTVTKLVRVIYYDLTDNIICPGDVWTSGNETLHKTKGALCQVNFFANGVASR